jgi:hypothetical protein
VTDRLYIVPFGDRTLALTADEFAAALERGKGLLPNAEPVRSGEPPVLVDAKAMGKLTSKPASWWSAAAREDDCPCVRLGSSVRFDPQEALRWLNDRQERDANGRSVAGPTPRARTL